MRLLTIILMVIFIFGCSNVRNYHNELIGTWKSNAEKTLLSMRSASGISDKAKKIFKDDFFGHLIVEYRKADVRVYFDRVEDNVEEMLEFYPYKLLEADDSKFVIESFDLLEKRDKVVTFNREGDCYYIEVSGMGFYEYFCKIK